MTDVRFKINNVEKQKIEKLKQEFNVRTRAGVFKRLLEIKTVYEE